MNLKNHQLALFSKNCSNKPQRLVWVDAGSGEQIDQAANQTIHDPSTFKSLEDYTLALKNAHENENALTKEQYDILVETGKIYFETEEGTRRVAKNKQSEYDQKKQEIEDKIAHLGDSGKKSLSGEIATKVKTELADIENGRISDITDLKAFVRDAIGDKLGIDFESDSYKNLKILENFQKEIYSSVKKLIGHDALEILAGVSRDKEIAENNYERIKKLFKGENLEFLEMLRRQKIPTIANQVNDLFDLAKRAKKNNNYEDFGTFIGVTGHTKLKDLSLALDDLEKLKDDIAAAEDHEQVILKKQLQNIKSGYAAYNKEIGERSSSFETVATLGQSWFGGTGEMSWSDKKRELEELDSIISEAGTKPERQFANVLLTSNESELASKNTNLENIQKKDDNEERNITSTSAPSQSSDYKHENGNIINQLGNTFKHLITADGKITWYSFHDITKTFELIKESWKKHIESHTEDKAGDLAEAAMFWRREIQRRVHEQDLQSEKSRASDRLKYYKNLKYESLIAELGEHPAKDKRRAILETLADRGNLRMSDRRMVDIVTNHKISDQTWNIANADVDYAEIYNIFKDSIDKTFIGEVGYGQELIDKQTSGQSSKESLGEKMGDHAIGGSTAAECGMVAQTIDRGGLEGDNVLTGILKKGFVRANKFANNGQTCTVQINGKDHTAEATVGLDALKIVDGYLRGNLGPQTLQGLSKKNEGGFTPYAAFQENLVQKGTEYPKGSGRYISNFEAWGWIENGQITELGKAQIMNYFETRVALDEDGNLHHIAVDSSGYIRHSSKHTSVSKLRNLSIPVGDKLMNLNLKSSGLDVYDNSTKKATGGSGEMNASDQEVTFLIKGAVEEIVDGAEMANYTGGKDSGQRAAVQKDGEKRIRRGAKALEIMFQNILTETRNRIILDKRGNPAYTIIDRDLDTSSESYGRNTENSKSSAKDLRGFLEYYLVGVAKLKDDPKFGHYYNQVMQAFDTLANDPEGKKFKEKNKKKEGT